MSTMTMRLKAVAIPMLFVAAASFAGEDELFYEGKNAAQWAVEFKAGNARATHAMSRLGKDAVPALLELLKDKDPKISSQAATLLSKLQTDAEAILAFMTMLNSEHFEVRRNAVKLLSKHVGKDAAVTNVVRAMLKDKDAAVVEAAEEALKPVQATLHLDDAKILVRRGDPAGALAALEKASALEPAHAEIKTLKAQLADTVAKQAAAEQARLESEKKIAAEQALLKEAQAQKRKTFDQLLAQARELIKQNDFDRPSRVIAEARKLFPDDPAVSAIATQLEKAKEGVIEAKANAARAEAEKAKKEFEEKIAAESARVEADKKRKIDDEKALEEKARLEAAKSAEQKAKEAAEKLAAEEKIKAEALKIAEEKAKAEAATRLAAEKAKAEADRLAQETLKAEEKVKAEALKAAQDKERAELAAKLAEEKARVEAERIKAGVQTPTKTAATAIKEADAKPTSPDVPKRRKRVGSEDVD